MTKVHPPPNPEWPDYVKRIYADGCARIDKFLVQIEEDGVCPIPFSCYGCGELRSDFGMVTGDDVPLCQKCLDRMCDYPADEESTRCD